jgi:hypothetical protein
LTALCVGFPGGASIPIITLPPTEGLASALALKWTFSPPNTGTECNRKTNAMMYGNILRYLFILVYYLV